MFCNWALTLSLFLFSTFIHEYIFSFTVLCHGSIYISSFTVLHHDLIYTRKFNGGRAVAGSYFGSAGL